MFAKNICQSRDVLLYFISVISLKFPLDFALAVSFAVNHQTCVPSINAPLTPPHISASQFRAYLIASQSLLIDLMYSSLLI